MRRTDSPGSCSDCRVLKALVDGTPAEAQMEGPPLRLSGKAIEPSPPKFTLTGGELGAAARSLCL